MAAPIRKWLLWSVVAAVLLAAGAALWFAHARSWLAPAETWAAGLFHHKEAGGQDMGGMDMSGMNMGSNSSSAVPDHEEMSIPYEVQQRIGVTVGRVEEASLRMSVRTVGIVRPDETRVVHIHLRTEGWVQKVFVDYVGQKVKKGDPLLAIYSPDFVTTQQQYLDDLKSKQSSLADLARQRLELWDVPAGEIKKIEDSGKPETILTLRSPREGTVLTRNAFEGQYVTAEKELYTLADLSTVWVQAKVYEYELPHIEVGKQADVTLPAFPGQTFTGKIAFIQAVVEEPARTVEVRVELPNTEGRFKPGMFANLVIQHPMGTGLLVPASAVLRTGERDIAYKAESEGRFVPVEVKISPLRFEDGRYHVLEGLKAGELVATSANFLIDSESRLRVGMGMMNMPGMDMGGKKGGDMKGMDMKGMDMGDGKKH
jgi:Cu(I)/Ag(I) efflux system membrane fusion protein